MEKSLNTKVWIGLVGLAIVFRFITFFPLTIDLDESTYLVMADHMLDGGVLYKDVIDIKPPGIFLIFSFIQLVFGKSIFLVRLITAITVGTGAFFIFKARRNWGSDLWPAIISGAVYIFMFNFYFGFSANTEVYFVFFTAMAIWLMSIVNGKPWRYLLVGAALGLGFLIKLHVAFDALAIGLFLLVGGFIAGKYKATIIQCAMLSIGFLVPYLATHLVYWISGYYEYYHYITYQAPFNYSVIRNSAVLAKYFKDGMITYLPFILMAIVGFFQIRKNAEGIHLLFLMMFVLEWAAILATGKPHPHYWLQLALPVSFLAGGMLENARVATFFRRKAVRITGAIILSGYLIFLFNYYHKRYIQRSLHTVNIHTYLEPLVKPEDRIYTGDGPQILYWLMDKKSPTPHIHQNHLTYPDKIATYEVDVEEEMVRIFTTDPRYVILSVNYPHDFVVARVNRDYELLATIDGFNIFGK